MRVNFQDWKIIWHFFRMYRLQSLIVCVLMFLSGFFEMLNLAALYPIINYGLNARSNNFVLEKFENITRELISDNAFFASCIVLITISILSVIIKFIYHYSSNMLMNLIVGETQKRVFDKLIAADYDFYIRNQQGELIYSGTTAPDRLSTVIFATISILYGLIDALFLFALLVVLSWQATCIVLLIGILYAIGVRKLLKEFIQKCAKFRVQEDQRKNVILNELITGIKPIKVFQAFVYWKSRYAQAVDKGLWFRFRILMGKILPEMSVKFLFFLLIAFAGIFLSQRPPAELSSLIPAFATFGVVVNRFLPSIHRIGSGLISIGEYVPDVHIVHEICTKEFDPIFDGKKTVAAFKNSIEFDGVWFKYRTASDYLLRNISFSIERKKMTALVGLSGSGKTTIINLLLKLYQPDKGAIRIDGTNIFELSNRSYLGMIGYVSQETFIFNNTFKENIRFGMDSCTDEMIEEAAKLANAHDFIMKTPQGYDSLVGDSGIKLSGGQRQRVAIARAMLRKPEIIVLDEATSSLDNISERKIQQAINNISKHTTVLVIAHRLSTVEKADKIIILENGEVKEQGTHEELLKNKSSYYDLYVSHETTADEISELIEG